METETELIQKAAQGDTSAFRILFEDYHQRIFNVCLRIIGDRGEAEDITQDVFVKVYKALCSFRHQSAFGTWIYRIALNLSFNHVRKNKKFRRISIREFESVSFSGAGQRMSDAARPDDMVEKKEQERIIARAIGTLPEKQRMAVILQRYEGHSVQSIAEHMHCSIESVQSLLQRAKKNLYVRLLPYLKKI